MAQNKVMKLWTAIITAFLALCTALGLVTTTAVAAVPRTATTRNCATPATTPSLPLQTRPHDRSLPPTMKQRIRAEAHGSSPSCHRHTAADMVTVVTRPAVSGAQLPESEPATPAAEPATPLQR
ncbi:hypothetical protein Sipo8835_36360 [Streptomyces ipomoeae]|jgi:hypothetical protein|uniref:Secreted protein n=1 Tax=Streptomyces ipomoeae TaxID=103232 RepID=A0AAE9AWL1_9ACTN|nr:DUF6344 domain-containing protein [Streptomyces ipomoeae]TQE21889.1 hypothetical protein Sipo8835_36360 [Streptomyces ipomoeae]